MTGDVSAVLEFLSEQQTNAETKKPQCVNGKPCGNSRIAKDKVCHK